MNKKANKKTNHQSSSHFSSCLPPAVPPDPAPDPVPVPVPETLPVLPGEETGFIAAVPIAFGFDVVLRCAAPAPAPVEASSPTDAKSSQKSFRSGSTPPLPPPPA